MSTLFPPNFTFSETPPAPPPPRAPWKSGAWIVAGLILLALAIAGLRHLIADSHPPARQVARIALLPDTPPPPPPPKVEKKDEPKPESRPQPQQQQLKKDAAPPAPAPLKMEGAAGNGPSAFSAGPVKEDYKGGPAVIGGTGTEGTAIDRAQQRLYANSVRQLLHDEMERQLGAGAGSVDAQLALWVGADGRISRWEVQSTSPTQEAELQAAMRHTADALQLPSPPPIPQPMRFRLSLHPAA